MHLSGLCTYRSAKPCLIKVDNANAILSGLGYCGSVKSGGQERTLFEREPIVSFEVVCIIHGIKRVLGFFTEKIWAQFMRPPSAAMSLA